MGEKSEWKARSPDLHLKAKPKSGGHWHVVGSAWVNETKTGQTISIQLNNCVVIDWRDEASLMLVTIETDGS